MNEPMRGGLFLDERVIGGLFVSIVRAAAGIAGVIFGPSCPLLVGTGILSGAHGGGILVLFYVARLVSGIAGRFLSIFLFVVKLTEFVGVVVGPATAGSVLEANNGLFSVRLLGGSGCSWRVIGRLSHCISGLEGEADGYFCRNGKHHLRLVIQTVLRSLRCPLPLSWIEGSEQRIPQQLEGQ